jgi:acyl-coenzyme A thioesterase PaaI-like protein
MLPLPHTSGCLVCGRDNPHGLRLDFSVDPDTALVRAAFTPAAQHIGFTGITHGGVLATVLDEAMVWAATWQGKRFCVCGELTVRYRRSASVGVPLTIEAKIETARPRLIQTFGTAQDPDGNLIAESSGKYVPMPPEKHEEVIASFLPNPATDPAASSLASALKHFTARAASFSSPAQ